MTDFYDTDEIQDGAAREQKLLTRLSTLIKRAQKDSAYYRTSLRHINADDINTRAALQNVPILHKSDLIKLQQQDYPFGGVNVAQSAIKRIFQSPGPIYDPQGHDEDYWRMGRAFYAAGFRAGDLVQNCLSYHLTPGGFMLDAGAKACGCTVIPAGPGQTQLQLAAINQLKPVGYCGTPSFLNILLSKGDIKSITKALVTGEALSQSLRMTFKDAGIDVFQAYGTADVGLIAYESEAKLGMIVNEDILVEIVRPGTNTPVSDGEVGEVVVTSFNETYPLIRFATGDLSAMLSVKSPCGRTNQMLKGWLGRADQTAKVKGMFVRPEQIAQIIGHYCDVPKARLVVSQHNEKDEMLLICESYRPQSLCANDIQNRVKEITKLHSRVKIVEVNSIVNDGKVIEDRRTIE